jgi:VWFA-related protein
MRTAFLALAVGCFASSVLAQPTETIQPLTERIEVAVTNVDVIVTDRSGHPVGGLSRDDFEILEDGRPEKLTNFYAIEDATVRLATKEDSSEGSIDPDHFRRKVVLLIDNNFIQKPNRNAALNRLDEFIDSHLAANVEWTLITIGHSVETMQPFTSDRQKMHAAIERVRHMPTFDEQRQLDRGLLSDPVRRSGLANGGTEEFGATVRFRAREQTMRNLNATLNTARAVIQTCHGFSAAEGKKIIILVTGGMEANTTFKAYDTEDDRTLSNLKLRTEQVLDTIVREANSANVNIYVINARTRGIQVPQHDVSNKSSGVNPGAAGSTQSALGSGPVDTTDVDSSSQVLASGTGGLYLPANNVARALERIDDETSTYYSLGFSPKHGDDGVYHQIQVRLRKSGLEVRHRLGYLNTSMHERLENSLLAPLTFPKEKGSLPVTIALGIPDLKDRMLAVPVTAEMPMNLLAIVPSGSGYSGRVHVYLSVYDESGNNVGYHHFVRDLNLTNEDYAHVAGSAFRYQTMLGLKPGLFTIVVTLRDDVTNEIGSASQALHL